MHIESLKVENFRALRDLVIDQLTPLTVLIGPNGSGKSTVLDVFAFLADCFEFGLCYAWDKRGRAKDLKTRGAQGPIVIEIKYREAKGLPAMTYHLAIDEQEGHPVVIEERLWRNGRPRFKFLEYREGKWSVMRGEATNQQGQRANIQLQSHDRLAVNVLGQLAEYPQMVTLRNFITNWCFVRSPDKSTLRGHSPRSAGELVQRFIERHPDGWAKISAVLQQYVPHAKQILAQSMPDGGLSLNLKDASFDELIPATFISDGTLKMWALLVLLRDPEPPPFIGLEGPEASVHPRSLPRLAEECRWAGERTQLLMTTYSPLFLNWLRPDEVRVLWRDEQGVTHAQRVSNLGRVREHIESGALLGWLWTSGVLDNPQGMHSGNLSSQAI